MLLKRLNEYNFNAIIRAHKERGAIMASLNHAKITNALDAIVTKCDKSSFFFNFLLVGNLNASSPSFSTLSYGLKKTGQSKALRITLTKNGKLEV